MRVVSKKEIRRPFNRGGGGPRSKILGPLPEREDRRVRKFFSRVQIVFWIFLRTLTKLYGMEIFETTCKKDVDILILYLKVWKLRKN